MNINWYPGHMKKTLDRVQAARSEIDFVIELLDARIPLSSRNPEISRVLEGLPRLVLLNKADLAEKEETKNWAAHIQEEEDQTLALAWVAQGQASTSPLIGAIERLMEKRTAKLKDKGVQKIKHRGMVVGIPNVGKSAFINQVTGKKSTKVGNKPGLTKQTLWYRLHPKLDLMDTPGLLWPRLEPQVRARHLAYTGSIKDEIMDIETLALNFIEEGQESFPQNILDRYGLEGFSGTPLETMEAIGRRRGALISGGEIDYTRVAKLILDDFRKGLMGPISLERVGDNDLD